MRVRLEARTSQAANTKASLQRRKRPSVIEISGIHAHTPNVLAYRDADQTPDQRLTHDSAAVVPYASANEHAPDMPVMTVRLVSPDRCLDRHVPPDMNTSVKVGESESQNAPTDDIASDNPWQLLDAAAREPAHTLPHREELEQQVGQSLADVEVYTNPLARAALAGLGARAATCDRQIFLADAHPEVSLLLHEVIHTLQAERGTQSDRTELLAAATPAEREAEHLTERALAPPNPAWTGPGPLSVRVGLPRHAIALRRSAGFADPAPAPMPDSAASAAFSRAVERPTPPTPTLESERAGSSPDGPPDSRESQPVRPEEATPPLITAGEAEPAFELPPPPEPGITAADLAAQEAAAAEATAALASGENPGDMVAAFAAAPPTIKAQHAARIGEDMHAVTQQEEQTFQAELPEFHAELNSQAEPVTPLSVETPAAETSPLEAPPPPAPEPDIPPTADVGRYTANADLAANVTRALRAGTTNRAEQIGDQLHDVQTSDPDIVTSPGPDPTVPLEGANDPQRIENQSGAGIAQSRQARDTAQQAVLAGPGPEQVQPLALNEAYPVGELMQPTIAPVAAPAEPQAFLDMSLPPEVNAAFDQQQQAAMQQSMEGVRSQVDQATTERDQQRETAVATAEQESRTLSEQADSDQRTRVQEQRGAIQTARQETLNAQTTAVRDIETDVDTRRRDDRSAIGDRVRSDEERVSERYDRTETDAQNEVDAGERDAEREREQTEREAEEQSWWDQAVDFVADAFEALTSAINTIFDAVRSAVNTLLDAAKTFAQGLIDAAARFINEAIAAFGNFLKGLVDNLLGDIFPELAAALNQAIDAAVELAQSAVNTIAEGLKAGINALIDGLQAGLNAILDVFQGALNLALGALQAALTGDWAALARMALEAVLRVAGIDPESFYQFIGRAMETFQLILDDPGGFVGNLVDAFLNGVRTFASNFLTHLQAGIIGWLTGAIGGAGITIPEQFDLMGVLSLIQQILGLTWERLRERAVRTVGERAVAMIEFVASYLQTLIEGGWSALWERIQSDLASLRDMVLDGIKSFLLERVVMAAITRLATMFNPVGAIVNLIIAAYNMFTFLRDQMQRIAEVVQTVVNAIGDIARGVIQPAAQRVEEVLARLLPLAIDLLARLLGLGNVGARVREIMERVQTVVDRAIDGLIERVRGLFRGGGGVGARPVVQGEGAAESEGGLVITRSFSMAGEEHQIFVAHSNQHLTIEMASGRRERMEGIVRDALASARTQEPHNEQLIGELNQVQIWINNIAEDERALNDGYSDRTQQQINDEISNLVRVLEGIGAHHQLKDLDDVAERIDRRSELVQQAIENRGIVNFLQAIARGETVDRVDRAMFGSVFNDRSGQEMVGSSTTREWIKNLFRAVRPRAHEWIPTSVIDRVVNRTADADNLAAGANWIDLQNRLRTDTRWVIFKENRGFRMIVNEQPYIILQGHVGASYFAGERQTRGEPEFHDELRGVFADHLTIGPYLDALKRTFTTWVWQGSAEPLSVLPHPNLRLNRLSMAVPENQRSVANSQKREYDNTAQMIDDLKRTYG